MSAPKDQRPVRGHHAQAILYEAGISGIGVDAATKLAPHEVRRHGVRQVGKRGMQVVLGGALAVGLLAGALHKGGEAIDYEIDRVDPNKNGHVQGAPAAGDGSSGSAAATEQMQAGEALMPGEIADASEVITGLPETTPAHASDPATQAEAGPDVAPGQ